MFKIALVGRPNVGKSTLFNKLAGKKLAITDDTPGVTRDRKEAKGKLGPLEFKIIDTAGLENEIDENSLEKRMFDQTQIAVIDADLCLFIVDKKEGITKKDIFFANWLRKLAKPVILVVNKCENLHEETFDKDFYKLGFNQPIAISAEHKLGFGELYEKISPEIDKYQQNYQSIESSFDDEEENDDLIQIAIIGKPNAGKSTFINKIIGQERSITGPEAGITRDAITIDFEFKGQKLKIIDTAGIRKKANIVEKLEKFSVQDSFHALRFAQVVILIIDCNSLLDHQDVALAGEVLKEGRGLVFAINKIDQVSGDKEVFMKKVRSQIQEIFPEISGAAITAISAQSGYNVEKAFDFAVKTYQQWKSYFSTTKLNEWMKIAENDNPPQLFKGKRIKLKYATQIKKRPPTIAIFTNHIDPLLNSYIRYLNNHFREYFKLNLSPVRMVLRKSENPFADRKEKKFSKKTHQKK
jgi:GTP-binding protein